MKKILLLIGMFYLTACNNNTSSNGSAGKANTQQAPKLTGTFQGTLPCADCPGINYQVTLFDDHTYSELTAYEGRGMNVATVEKGSWKQLSDSTVLIQRKKDSTSFLLADGHLLLLDPKGHQIEGVLASNYVLNAVEGGDKRKINDQKKQAGIRFTANGNEPGWTLDIDRKQITFHSQNGDEIQTPLPAPNPNLDTLKVYTTSKITVSIRNTVCTDDMSGVMRPNTVQISIKDKVLQGCGEYLDK